MEHEASELSPGEIAALAARIDRPVVLVGMMGTGKSSVGRRIASLLHFPFLDADEEIETAAQMSIPEIFASYGEPYFRDGERRVIARLLEGPPIVLATGGGAFMNPETRALIKASSTSVWLKADLNVLARRVARKDNRPLLTGKDPLTVLKEQAEARYPAYSEADITVETGDSPHQVTVDQVIRALTDWQARTRS